MSEVVGADRRGSQQAILRVVLPWFHPRLDQAKRMPGFVGERIEADRRIKPRKPKAGSRLS